MLLNPSHSNSALGRLYEEPSVQSRRKSSWSNFLNRPEEESFQRPSNRTFSKVADYNIQDYLPKRGYRLGIQTKSLIDDDINMPFVLTARFPDPNRAGKENHNTKESSGVSKDEYEKLQEENKKQKQLIQQLQACIQQMKKVKVPKILGWSQRIEIKVLPKIKSIESKSTQTQILIQKIGIQKEPQERFERPTSKSTTTAILSTPENYLPRRTNIRQIRQRQLKQPIDTRSSIPMEGRATIKDYAPIEISSRQATTRQPPKRIRKQYTELYPIRTNQVDQIVRALMSYDKFQ